MMIKGHDTPHKILSWLFLCFVAALFFSCTKEDGNRENEQLLSLPSAFSGEVPCADCPGIIYSVILEESAYTEVRRYINRSPMTFTQTGPWSVIADTLFLNKKNGSAKAKFLFRDGELHLLDSMGNRIEGELSDFYVLDQRPEIASIWIQERNDFRDGIIYRASGNEPFWGAKVNRDNRLVYSEPGDSLIFDSVNLQTGYQQNVRISAENKEAVFVLTLENRLCVDSMSGAPFSYTASLVISRESARPDTLSGCGSVLSELYTPE